MGSRAEASKQAREHMPSVPVTSRRQWRQTAETQLSRGMKLRPAEGSACGEDGWGDSV